MDCSFNAELNRLYIYYLYMSNTDADVIVGPSIVKPTMASGELLFNQLKLQQYLLLCAQQLDGGMRGESITSHETVRM